jgi:hypothetical protein
MMRTLIRLQEDVSRPEHPLDEDSAPLFAERVGFVHARIEREREAA